MARKWCWAWRLARIGENAKDVVEAVKGKIDTVRDALPEGIVLKPIYERTDLVNKAVGTAMRALDRRFDPGRDHPVPVPGRSALGRGGRHHLAAGDADRLHRHGPGRSVGQPDVAGRLGDRHRHDGRRCGGDGRERVPDHGRASGARRKGRPNRRRCWRRREEVANPITFAIIIIIVVFLPLFALEGLEGKMFKPMAFNIAFAMAGSMILSLTLIPVLASMILKPKPERDTWLVARIKRGYRPLLARALAKQEGRGGQRGRRTGRRALPCSRSSARSSCRSCRKARSCGG